MSGAGVITAASVVKLARGVRLQHDKVRERSVLLAPERTIALDPVAVAIVEALDGVRSVNEVINHLAQAYNAPVDVIGRDVTAFLTELGNRRLLEIA